MGAGWSVRAYWTAMLLGAVAGSAALAAQPDAKTQAKVLQDLSACPRIAEDAKRLACYDAAARALLQAETEGDVVVVDRAQAREVRRQSFGFQIPSLKLFDRAQRAGGRAPDAKTVEDEDNQATAVVAAVGRTGEGRLLLTTSEGAVWAQTDTLQIAQTPRKGEQVVIRRSAFGGYFCNISRHQSVRCERRK